MNAPKRLVIATASMPNGGAASADRLEEARRHSDTAPNTPPCILIILIACRWLSRSVAPQQSSSSRHSKPRSLASRIVVWTQTSVVMPVSTMLPMPLSRSISSRSVAQNEPLPGLSMIGSPGGGRQLRDDLPARLAAHQNAAAGPRIADAGADAARPPALVLRQVGEIGTMAFAGVEDLEAALPHRRQHRGGSVRSARGSATGRSPSCRHSRRRRRNRSACR